MSGVWFLIIIVQIGEYQIKTMPLFMYDESAFGFYQCEIDKDKYNKTVVQKYKFSCIRQGEV